MTKTWEMYDGQIYDMRQQGQSLQDIGGVVGRTRERVRQILVEHYGSAEIKNDALLTRGELASLTNLSKGAISKLTKKGVIKRVRMGLWPVDALETLLERRRCIICSSLLPSSRSSYCSEGCAQKGHKIMEQRCGFRRLHRRFNKPITASVAYIYPKRSPYYSGGGQ